MERSENRICDHLKAQPCDQPKLFRLLHETERLMHHHNDSLSEHCDHLRPQPRTESIIVRMVYNASLDVRLGLCGKIPAAAANVDPTKPVRYGV